MTIDEFFRTVVDELELDLPGPPTPGTHLFLDARLDSLQALELLMVVETLAGCDAPPAEPPQLLTFRDAFEHYESLRAGAAASS